MTSSSFTTRTSACARDTAMEAHNSQFLRNPRDSVLCPSSVAPSPAVTTCAGLYGQASSPDDLRAAGGGGNGRQTSPARLKRRRRRLWRAPTVPVHRTRPQGACTCNAPLVSGQARGTCVLRPWLSASGPAANGPYRVTAAHTRDDGQRIGGSRAEIDYQMAAAGTLNIDSAAKLPS